MLIEYRYTGNVTGNSGQNNMFMLKVSFSMLYIAVYGHINSMC